VVLGRLPRVVEIVGKIYMFCLVMCGHNFLYRFCNKQPWLPCGATLLTSLLMMTTEKSMMEAFVVMAVAEAQASLQAV
jgi:hypothetical protein